MLTIRIQHLIEAYASSRASNPQNIASRRLLRLHKCLTSVDESIASLLGEPDDVCVLHQHQDNFQTSKQNSQTFATVFSPLVLKISLSYRMRLRNTFLIALWRLSDCYSHRPVLACLTPKASSFPNWKSRHLMVISLTKSPSGSSFVYLFTIAQISLTPRN